MIVLIFVTGGLIIVLLAIAFGGEKAKCIILVVLLYVNECMYNRNKCMFNTIQHEQYAAYSLYCISSGLHPSPCMNGWWM